MLVIGLTGGIGSGKSKAADFFRDQGVEVINLDQVSRDLVEPGSPALQQIVEHFGNQILDAEKCLNRPKLRQLIFSDTAARHWLESLLHPLIEKEKDRKISEASSPYVVVESPLLVEGGSEGSFDRVLVIDCTVEQQIERASRRDGNSIEQIERIVATQASRTQRNSVADDLVNNGGTEQELFDQLGVLHQRYMSDSQLTP